MRCVSNGNMLNVQNVQAVSRPRLCRNGSLVLTPSKLACHVNGCIIDCDKEVRTATGHNCVVCKAPVHYLCCQRVLGIGVNDADELFYCSACREPPITTEITEAIEATAPSTENMELPVGKCPGKSVKMAPGSKGVKVRRSGSLAKMYQAVKRDLDLLLCREHVRREQHTRRRRKDADICEALLFIFNSRNVQLLILGLK